MDDDGNPQTVEPQQQPAGEDLLLKKAVEVVTKGKGADVVSNGTEGPKAKPGPVLTPLNVPEPAQRAAPIEFRQLPIYEYKCDGCGETFEVIQKFADEPLTVHEKCGGAVHRLLFRARRSSSKVRLVRNRLRQGRQQRAEA